jgi:hypothetical protein
MIEERCDILGWTTAELYSRIIEIEPFENLAYSTVSRWMNGQTSRQNKPWVVYALQILDNEIEKLSTSVTLPGKTQTGVYYNESLDSAFGLDVAVNAWVVPGSSEWSVKSVSVKTLIVSALPGAAGVKAVVKITEQFGVHKPGTVFFFKETDYPTEGVVLLAEHHEDSDRKMLMVIEDGKESPLKEWKLTHYAFAKGIGAGDVVSEGQWAQGGISFR